MGSATLHCFAGMAASKKWKYTVRVQHDGRPIGTWLEMHGYALKPMLYATVPLSGNSGSVQYACNTLVARCHAPDSGVYSPCYL